MPTIGPKEIAIMRDAADISNAVQQHFAGKTTGVCLMALANLVAMAERRGKDQAHERAMFNAMIDMWGRLYDENPEMLQPTQ